MLHLGRPQRLLQLHHETNQHQVTADLRSSLWSSGHSVCARSSATDGSKCKPCFKIKRCGSMEKLQVSFRNLFTGQQVTAGVWTPVDFPNDPAIIWMYGKREEELVVLARVARQQVNVRASQRLEESEALEDALSVEIAAQVDQALIVVLCVALVETIQQRTGSNLYRTLVVAT